MWSELKERLRATQRGQQEMQIHQDPLPNHAVAHVEAESILLVAQSELVTIQADPAQGPPAEEDNEPNAAAIPIPEVWSNEGSIK